MIFQVIMPIGRNRLRIEQQATIASCAHNLGLAPNYPDAYDPAAPFDIHGFIGRLERSAFVFVDLSYESPSCYYELGVAESIGKVIVAVAQKGTDIHQSANRAAVRFYGCDYESAVREALTRGKLAT